jgi:hypothetical protein
MSGEGDSKLVSTHLQWLVGGVFVETNRASARGGEA